MRTLSLDHGHKCLLRRDAAEKPQIFCPVRKKWLQLTSEEWVRQLMIQQFVHMAGYPLEMMQAERLLQIGERQKRFDLVVYKDAAPWMVVEFKEPAVPITAITMQQALAYNSRLQARYLLLSNGIVHYCWQLLPQVQELSQLPAFG